ncbi:hypothetical protein [Brevundimonas lenta]|uniref:Lipoprotein n=1 Tax=Brevundimonas lenta TaxID=424796 RepID=A0A7W6JGG5_9CAUL|nr:hypothetical protein [Brevundimonas lenta]MBB4083683.1 hypothetical protein [Brevundimonas lenta]
MRRAAITAAGALALLSLAGCTPLMAGYSLDAYRNATSLKPEVMAMVDRSAGPWAANADAVAALTIKLEAAYEFSAGMAQNEISTAQWRVLKDPNGGLYGGFVRTWREQGTTGEFYRTEKKAQLGEAFDYIICLEVNKKEPARCKPPVSAGGGA